MIYDEPIYRPLGDAYLAVEFGDEADLTLNFRVLALSERLEEESLPGIIDMIPTLRTLGISFDSGRTSLARVQRTVEELIPEVVDTEKLSSRLFRLPLWYQDPWTTEISRRDGLSETYIESIAEANGISVEQLIDRHSGTDHWITCLGWAPGCYFAYALDETKRVTAPKLLTPRTYAIPVRIVTLGGVCTSCMPVVLPSGYRLLGRLAVDIYDPVGRNPAFPDHGALFRAGDRHRYYSVGALEYEEIQQQVQAGTYEYEVLETEFDVAHYRRARSTSDPVMA